MTEATLIRARIRFEREFTQLPNAWLRDNRLSFRARGVLSMLMSHKPGEFKVTLKALANDNPEGLSALRAAVEELEAQGYLRRYRKARGGQFQPDTWEICDPHELDAPPVLAAFENRTRKPSAFENRTRTASENRTPIRTLEEDSSVNEVPNVAAAQKCAKGHDLLPEGGYCVMGCNVRRHLEAVTS